jgi:hypothetical protein
MFRILDDIEQGTEEWHLARCDIPTASCFGKLLTAKTMKPSTQADGYMFELLAAHEQKLNGYFEPSTFTNEWMQRGTEMEAEARLWYELSTGVTVEQAGFCFGHNDLYGCSPDGLIGLEGSTDGTSTTQGGVEIKCPKNSTLMKCRYANEIPSEYIPQVYGSMYVTGADYWDFLMYCPGMRPFQTRVTAEDPQYLKWVRAFDTVLNSFVDKMVDERAKIQKEIETKDEEKQ